MRGLTLLEVLVSISILAIIMAAIYGAYSTNVEAIQLARHNSEVYQMARIAFEYMTKDLESAYLDVPLYSDGPTLGMIGKNQEIDGKPADRLDFTTLTHIPLTDEGLQTDLCEVGYKIVEDEENAEFVLYRRDDGIVDNDFTEGGYSSELARMVTALDIVFENSEGEEFHDWNTLEEEHAETLPSLITIRLTIRDKQGRERTFTTRVHPALAEMKKK